MNLSSIVPAGLVGPQGPSGANAQVDTYTTTGSVLTWTKPTGAKSVEIITNGAGGGGGGGAGSSAAANRMGGSGGGAGARCDRVYHADQIPASLYVIVGAGGTAGTAGSASAGGAGGAGGNSTVATNNTNPPISGILCMAGGGVAERVVPQLRKICREEVVVELLVLALPAQELLLSPEACLLQQS